MRTLISALAVLVALSGPSFASFQQYAQEATSVPPAEVAPPALIGVPAPEVHTGPSSDVRVNVLFAHGMGNGSGVYLGNGIVVTANHVVSADNPKAGALKAIKVVIDRNGVAAERLDAEIVGASKKADMAILKVTDMPKDMRSAELACREPEIGEQIEVVGNPLGIDFIHTWGRVAGAMRQLPGQPQNMIPIDAEIAPGNSGGPIYDKDGKVLGLADMLISTGSVVPGTVKWMTSVLSLPMCHQESASQ